MTAAGTEALPTTWNDDRDGAFFRITATLFPPAFTSGASVLLASYDDECAPMASTPREATAVSTDGVAARANITGVWSS